MTMVHESGGLPVSRRISFDADIYKRELDRVFRLVLAVRRAPE